MFFLDCTGALSENEGSTNCHHFYEWIDGWIDVRSPLMSSKMQSGLKHALDRIFSPCC